jgi:NADH-dependant formate dehydrogenase delta subunit FdsD
MSTTAMKPADKLVMMANQIARAFAAQGEARAVPKIADHIGKFRDPRMRSRCSRKRSPPLNQIEGIFVQPLV